MSEELKPDAGMSNSDLQEAITMANAMVKGASLDSPTYHVLRTHLETLLLIQQKRAGLMVFVA